MTKLEIADALESKTKELVVIMKEIDAMKLWSISNSEHFENELLYYVDIFRADHKRQMALDRAREVLSAEEFNALFPFNPRQ